MVVGVNPSTRKAEEENHRFEGSLGKRARPCLKIENERETDRQTNMKLSLATEKDPAVAELMLSTSCCKFLAAL